MLINCTGVQTLQFIRSAGQNPLFILAAKAAVSCPCKGGEMQTMSNTGLPGKEPQSLTQ